MFEFSRKYIPNQQRPYLTAKIFIQQLFKITHVQPNLQSFKGLNQRCDKSYVIHQTIIIFTLMAQIQAKAACFPQGFFCFNCNHEYDAEIHYPYTLCAHLHTLCHYCLVNDLFKGKEQSEEVSCNQCEMTLKLSSAYKFVHLAELIEAKAKSRQSSGHKQSEVQEKTQVSQNNLKEELQKQRQLNKWLIQYSTTLNCKYQQILAKQKMSEAELSNKIKKYQTNLEKLSKEFWKVRGDHQFEQQNHEKIIQFSQQIIRNSFNYDYNTHGFGNIEDQVGLFESDVVKWYTLGRNDKNYQSSPYDILSLSYLITKNFGQAQVWYTNRLAKNDSNYQLVLGLANTKYNLGKYAQAEKLYKKVIQIKPTLEKPYQQIAFIKLLKQNNKREARQWAIKTKENNNKNIYADYILAVTQQTSQAQIQSLLKISENNKNYARIFNGVASAYKAKNNFEEAIKYYKKAIEINPKYDSPFNGIGIIHYLKGDNEQAVKWFEECIKINPKYENPYFGLGTINHKLNKNEQALKYYKKCVDLNPNNCSAYNGLGVIEATLLKYDQALKHFKKCIGINPSHKLSYNSLGNVHLNLGQFDEAIKCYEKAIELDSKYGAPYNGLSNVYSKKGNDEQAKKWHEKKVQAIK